MPTYHFRDTKTGEITEEFMSISQREEYMKQNPHLEPYIESAPMFSYTGSGDFQSKTDNTWKEVMAKVTEAHPNSAHAQKFPKRRTIKEIKTQEVLDKHKKRRIQSVRS